MTPRRVLVLEEPVHALRWVFAWRTPNGLTVTCEHTGHLTAPGAARCQDRLRVETDTPPWEPLGPRPAP